MAYRDFKLSELKERFAIQQNQAKLFDQITPVEPSKWLVETLKKKRKSIRATTEKAVSETIISPILSEVQERNEDKLTLFSGENLPADKHSGLNGEVDFLFIRQPDVFEISAPIIQIIEAKLNQAIDRSIGQAAAQLIGAKKFNENELIPLSILFGCITNGSQWVFLKLENNIITVDEDEYSSANLPELLGVFQGIVNFYA